MCDNAAQQPAAAQSHGRGNPGLRTTTAGRTRLGRSGPRSRSGCVTCKQRRVRCDEVHPVCGHCTRLQLNCHYAPQSQRWRQQVRNGSASMERNEEAPSTTPSQTYLGDPHAALDLVFESSVDYLSLSAGRRQRSQNGPEVSSSNAPPAFGTCSRSGHATPIQHNTSWAQARRFDFDDIFSDLNTSWAGDFTCMQGDVESPTSPSFQQDSNGADPFTSVDSAMAVNGGNTVQNSQCAVPENGDGLSDAKTPRPNQHLRRRPSNISAASSSRLDLRERRFSDHDSSHLIQLFKKIIQPPAAILIGGFERWRRLQHYLCKLSDQSLAVNSSLLCVIEFLMIDETAKERGQDWEACMKRILDRHALACEEIERKLSKHTDLKPKTREHLLAAIFLLSWFEVIRDQDAHSSLFPRHLADVVITGDATWSRYSQQLLSWLNTLDSKATHLGGKHLLPPKSLEVVSHYPTQITSSLEQGEDSHGKYPDDSELSLSDMSPGDSHHSPEDVTSHSPILKMGQVKQVMLNTILQPALEWYLTSQSYCRRISAHDKHHRKRFTSDDEYEVITACKQLESELFELWDYRPAIISVAAEQLIAVVAPDIATRLEEIFSIYRASFWILFVYLHRVSWWNLPHSALAGRALGEVWQNMQRAYGEEVNGPLHKIIHPSLLWPVFLFGSECPDPFQRTWAIEQLEALGEAKPVLQSEPVSADTLPPFRLSSGATRNAKRAAALLRELIKEQDAKQARVDDRDLSMKMFGCYFSIV